MHSILAPSSAHRWVPCPGSIGMCRDIPDEETEANREGTLAHEIAATVLNGGDYPADIHPDMKEAVALYVKNVGEGAVIEQRVDCPYIGNFGTPDAYKLNGLDHLTIWDFKYGFRHVSAYQNWQLINYASGILALHPHVTHVTFRIVQPRVFTHNPVSSWQVTVAQLEPLFDEMKAAAAEAMTNYARCVPGTHCRDCMARGVCSALGMHIGKVLDTKYLPVTRELDNVQIGRELRLMKRDIKMMEYRIAALEEQAIKTINDGLPVPGFTTKPSTGRLKWDKPVEEIMALGEMFGVSLGKGATVTPTQAIKDGIPENVVNGYASRPDNGMKLVETDFYK